MADWGDICRVCAGEAKYLWNGEVLDLSLRYYECSACGYVQTEAPFWLDRAYASAINRSDTGILARNLLNAQIVMATLILLHRLNERIVDYAGGYGLLVR